MIILVSMGRLYHIVGFFALAIGLHLFSSGCTKISDTSAAQPSGPDSTKNGGTAAASANCLDSLVGTYSGFCSVYYKEEAKGQLIKLIDYKGPDTVAVKTNSYLPPGYFFIEGRHIGKSSTFQFDSSQSSRLKSGNEVLSFFPNQDSIIYYVSMQAGMVGDGTFTSVSFYGGKH